MRNISPIIRTTWIFFSDVHIFIYIFRIAVPFVKEQTSASAWLIRRDISLPLFNKLSQVSTLLGEQVEDTASERVMAIIGDFRTLKGNLSPQVHTYELSSSP